MPNNTVSIIIRVGTRKSVSSTRSEVFDYPHLVEVLATEENIDLVKILPQLHQAVDEMAKRLQYEIEKSEDPTI